MFLHNYLVNINQIKNFFFKNLNNFYCSICVGQNLTIKDRILTVLFYSKIQLSKKLHIKKNKYKHCQ